jgi:hypothetical protein
MLKQVLNMRKPDLSGLRSSAYEFIHRQLLSTIVCIHRSPASIVFPQLPASVCFINYQHRLKPTPHNHPSLLKQVAILRKPDLSGLRSSAYEFIHRRLSSSIGCVSSIANIGCVSSIANIG